MATLEARVERLEQTTPRLPLYVVTQDLETPTLYHGGDGREFHEEQLAELESEHLVLKVVWENWASEDGSPVEEE